MTAEYQGCWIARHVWNLQGRQTRNTSYHMGKSPPSNTAALKLRTIQLLLYLQIILFTLVSQVVRCPLLTHPTRGPIWVPLRRPLSIIAFTQHYLLCEFYRTIVIEIGQPWQTVILFQKRHQFQLLGRNSDHITVVLVSRYNGSAAWMPQLVVVGFKWIVVVLSPM